MIAVWSTTESLRPRAAVGVNPGEEPFKLGVGDAPRTLPGNDLHAIFAQQRACFAWGAGVYQVKSEM